MTDLNGKKVLVIVTNYGVEQDELVVPVDKLRESGATVTVAAVSSDPITTLDGDKDPGREVAPDTTLDQVQAADYDLLIVPGGTVNADTLRLNDDALSITKSFSGSGRPIAAICHGPWVAVEAGIVDGKQLTSYASLRTDLTNAGAQWTDASVVTDDGSGYTLITSRNPHDLDDFVGAIEKALTA
ncbi:type 1 glutamine amidotransferase [Rhodococcus rhodnii]|uniref:Protease n=2 Tax=Rhodococcus rhodnii TaxID=38312 RepID=R7WK78_9NOCA|nr:type 1 glutamine amidotransferase domain-containing protein [Rhodococcus rhodnii]EOM75713.1 protease [Rhodococcus rhodnii LMG 5362]TXG89647.1 type 1 glutamine amidotransferase [Rhodococcus rhodnii]